MEFVSPKGKIPHMVSSTHCVITRGSDGKFSVEDRSSNGIWVGAEQKEGITKLPKLGRRELKYHDAILLGVEPKENGRAEGWTTGVLMRFYTRDGGQEPKQVCSSV